MARDFLTKWNNFHCEDYGAGPSPDCLAFVRDARTWIRSQAKKRSMELVSFKYNHYDFSGFLKSVNGAFIYFAYNLRNNELDHDGKLFLDLFRTCYAGPMLVRAARDENDYSGGQNHFCAFVKLLDTAEEIAAVPNAAEIGRIHK